eukprot:154110_1
MSSLFLIFSTVIIVNCAYNKLPNVNYVGYGYNVIKGNPHTTGDSDSGWLGGIFNTNNYTENNKWNEYSIPNGISVISADSCDGTSTYSSITGTNSYKSALEVSVSIHADGVVDEDLDRAAFSASADFQKIYHSTSSDKSVYTSSYYTCSVYTASLNLPFDIPTVSKNFNNEVEAMPIYYDPSNRTVTDFFYKFLNDWFGTHYVSKITMGGIFGTLSSMNSYSYSKYTSSNLVISTSASFSTLLASASASAMTDSEKEQAETFNNITESQTIFNISGNIPSDGTWTEWRSEEHT